MTSQQTVKKGLMEEVVKTTAIQVHQRFSHILKNSEIQLNAAKGLSAALGQCQQAVIKGTLKYQEKVCSNLNKGYVFTQFVRLHFGKYF